jgi:hypothetical protein
MVSSGQQGELESLLGTSSNGPGEHQTLLRSFFSEHAARGGSSGELSPQSAAGPAFFEQVDGHNTVELPHGFVLRHHAVGEGMTLLNGDNQPVARGLHMSQDGFTPASQEALQKAGVIHEQTLVPVSEAHHVTETTSAREYFAHAPAGTAHVERTLWYDGQNQMKLDWGNGGSGVDHGNYEFNVSHMTAAGSEHAGLSANAKELMREGKLHLLLSASDTTQSHPFSIAIDSHGNAHIPRESVAGRSLFSNNAGQAEFHGRYAEVAQVVGHSDHGGAEQVRVLATAEGNGVNTIHHAVTRYQPELRLRTTLQVPGQQVFTPETIAASPADSTDLPPIVSVNTGRREMRPAGAESNPTEAPTRVFPAAAGAVASAEAEPTATLGPRRRSKLPPEPSAGKAAAAKSRKKPSKQPQSAEQPPQPAKKPFLKGPEAAKLHKRIDAAQNAQEITKILDEMAQRGYIKVKSGNVNKPESIVMEKSKNVGSRLAKQAILRAQRLASDSPDTTT